MEIKEVGKITIYKDEVIGRGCQGTLVFKGTFDNRTVAVKRLIKDSLKIFEREVQLLKNIDEDQNIVRYFCSAQDDDFYYIAIELCICTLDEFISSNNFNSYKNEISQKEILRQVTSGLSYMHSNEIVHRDIKAANILFTKIKGKAIMKISDFGYSKDLSTAQSSRMSVAAPLGSQFWLSPEAINGNRCNKPCDIYALGCVFFFVMNGGRNVKVTSTFSDGGSLENWRVQFNFSQLPETSDNVLIEELIKSMVAVDPGQRVTVDKVLKNPFFWNDTKILNFVTDISNRLERRDSFANRLSAILEENSINVTKSDWLSIIDASVRSELQRKRGYSGSSVCDLLRAIRNKVSKLKSL